MKNIPDDQKKTEQENWLQDRAETYRIYVKTSAVGLEVALCIGVGIGVGHLADRYFNSGSIGMLVGISLGSVAAGRAIYYFVKKYLQAEARSEQNGSQRNESDKRNRN